MIRTELCSLINKKYFHFMEINMKNVRNQHGDYNSDMLENLCFTENQDLLMSKRLDLKLYCRWNHMLGL